MEEKFNIMKLLSSPFSKIYWVKVIMYLFGSGFLVFVALGVWRGYFKKPDPTTSQEAKRIVNHYSNPKVMGFGCATIKVYEKKTPLNKEIENEG